MLSTEGGLWNHLTQQDLRRIQSAQMALKRSGILSVMRAKGINLNIFPYITSTEPLTKHFFSRLTVQIKELNIGLFNSRDSHVYWNFKASNLYVINLIIKHLKSLTNQRRHLLADYHKCRAKRHQMIHWKEEGWIWDRVNKSRF